MNYKDWILNRAEEIAYTLYERELHELLPEEESDVYSQAVEDYKDYLADQIDNAYERMRDEQ